MWCATKVCFFHRLQDYTANRKGPAMGDSQPNRESNQTQISFELGQKSEAPVAATFATNMLAEPRSALPIATGESTSSFSAKNIIKFGPTSVAPLAVFTRKFVENRTEKSLNKIRNKLATSGLF